MANDWYVSVTGSPTGNGSSTSPWDLQTALNHPAAVQPGDTIWLRGGTYDGRFRSYLNGSSAPNGYITVSGYPGETVILNGNVPSGLTSTQKQSFNFFYSMEAEQQADYLYFNSSASNTEPETAVLQVRDGGYTIFTNFEITFLGSFTRNAADPNFERIGGVDHTGGPNCKFINLVIYNTPGTGVNTWKFTEGSEIYGCLVYNNGWDDTDRGHGPGFYVQNASDSTRLIKNNIIFNNYYKGIDVWSACVNVLDVNVDPCAEGTVDEYVKNVTLNENIIFNSASPYYGVTAKKDNIFTGSDDNTGVNRARNISIINNYLYHTTDYTANGTLNESPSLTIGWNPNSPVENVTVNNNFISGRNNALRFFYAKTLTFNNNITWGRYILANPNNVNSNDISNWQFSNNQYFTRFSNGCFRILTTPTNTDLSLSQWQTNYTIDTGSTWQDAITAFNPTVNKVIQNQYNPNKFIVVLFNKQNNNMTSNFSTYNFPIGTPYEVRDAENYHSVIQNTTDNTGNITFDMQSSLFELPTNNTLALKSERNFGVYLVEFFPCLPHKTITTAVAAGNTDNQQAQFTITASNTIESTANARYHAGTSVILTNGFHSKSGSIFRAYIEGCSGTYFGRESSENYDNSSDYSSQSEKSLSNYDIKIYPNPANSLVTITADNYTINKLIVNSVDGKQIFSKEIDPTYSFELDASNFTNGIYILTIETKEGSVFTKKLVKK